MKAGHCFSSLLSPRGLSYRLRAEFIVLLRREPTQRMFSAPSGPLCNYDGYEGQPAAALRASWGRLRHLDGMIRVEHS